MLRSFIKKHPALKKLAVSILCFPKFIKYYIIYPLKGFVRLVFASCNKNFMKELKNLRILVMVKDVLLLQQDQVLR